MVLCDKRSFISWLTLVLLCSASIGLSQSSSASIQPNQQSPNLASAERTVSEAQQLLAEGTAVSKRKAIEKLTQAIPLWRAAGDKWHEAITLSLIGKIYDLLGEKQNSLNYYTQTLTLVRAVGDRASEAATLNNIGLIYDSLGEKQNALDYYNSALAILQQTGDRRVEAITMVNIGLLHDSMGEKQTALSFYQRALPLLIAVHDRGGEAVALNNIGYLYDSIGEQQKALTYFARALPILREVGDTRVEAITLNNIGYVYDALGEKQKALDYYNRSLPVLRVLGDRRMEAVTLNNIGLVHKSTGDENKALELLDQALKLRRAVGDRSGEAVTLSDLGSIHTLLGETRQALDLYNAALQLSRAVADRNTEATTLRRVALVKRDQGALEEARRYLEDALAVIEHLRTRIPGQDLRASYFASVEEFFESYIDVLMRLHKLNPKAGYDAQAFEASERARARTLLDSLAEAHAHISEGVAPGLLQRERSLQQELDVTAEQQARLPANAHFQEQSADLKEKLENLLTQYQEIEAEIRISSPRYAALTQPRPASLKEIQQQVVDSNTLLLEYALGDEKSYLWAVTSSSIKSFELPPGIEIEAATRHLYELLTARNKHIRFETPEEQRARIAIADAEYVSISGALSRMLLGQVGLELDKKRLLIVSDGALNYLPFAALPNPASVSSPLSVLNNEKSAQTKDNRQLTGNEQRSYDPLIVDHEIVSLPSASTLSVLRRELSGRLPAPKILAMLADPVFERDDERVKSNKAVQRPNTRRERSFEVKSTIDLTKTGSFNSAPQSEVDGPAQIHRLPFTRREAEDILALVPESDRLKALDFEASRATATSPVLGQYRYVHFATHGFLNAAHPELSGIVLSLVNRQGEEQNGFLWAHEVYNLHLPVELVVLNGCRTGLGKQIRGEGLVGLTRGFMYAGSARVLVSLWDISDEASAELMAHLYKALLKDHMTPAAALRAAQMAILKERRWQAPYYWSAFVLQGEPR